MKKVVIVNTYLTGGGAAIAAYRLAKALKRHGGIDVSFLCLHGDKGLQEEADFNISPIVANGKFNLSEKINFVSERLQIYLNNGLRKDKIFHISTALWGVDISNHPLVLDADIIHLHWICQGMMSLKSLDKLSMLNKKIIWTLHDMWPVTAVSPHLKDPNIYVSPWHNKEQKLVERVWNLKKSIYPQLNPVLVGCSNWIKEKAEKSELACNLKTASIPNPIDTDMYSPKEPKRHKDSFTIIFGAVNTSDPRKGFKQIINAIKLLKGRGSIDRLNIKIKIFGYLDNNATQITDNLGLEYIGYIESQHKMIDIYRQADCLVVPSLFENLPNTIMEAMSCALPSVAFDVGGIPEMIDDGVSGFICSVKDGSNGLAFNIEKLATLYHNDFEKYIDMCCKCRAKAVSEYSEEVVSCKYIELYNLDN